VPDADFTTQPGDTIEITSPALGTLTNHVVAVGNATNGKAQA
jgi:2-dehydro-3-deoxy-D-arabinonate dehydratase